MAQAAQIVPFPTSGRQPEHIHDGGYVRSYRRLFTDGDSTLGTNKPLIGAWMEMYHRAAHEPTQADLGELKVPLERGQLVISLRDLAASWRVSWSTFWGACKRMQASGRITMQTIKLTGQLPASHRPTLTLVTICNYSAYQASFDTDRPTPGQLPALYNKEKKDSESKTDSESRGERRETRSDSESQQDGKENNKTSDSRAKSADRGVKRYAFEGRVIRLTRPDFDRWDAAYAKLDLRAELTALDDWLMTLPPGDRSNGWFHRVSACLAKKNRAEYARNTPISQRKWDGIL